MLGGAKRGYEAFLSDLYTIPDISKYHNNRFTHTYAVVRFEESLRDGGTKAIIRLQTDNFIDALEIYDKRVTETTYILKRKGYDTGYYPLNAWSIRQELKKHRR